MSSVQEIVVEPGKNVYPLEDILRASRIWLDGKESDYQLFSRFLRASRTLSRRYTLSLDEILNLGGQSQRAEVFFREGVPLGCEVVDRLLAKTGVRPSDISRVLFTSCTCPAIPSIDAEILQRLGFPPTTRRLPIYQQGCAGGVVGLSAAEHFARLGETVLLISIELCSHLFRLRESSPVHLLGSALFADGAAASLITPGTGRLQIIDSHSFLIPESRHLMGYDIRDDGAHLKLDRDLPSALQNVLKEVVGGFLAKHSLKPQDVPWWLIHPGGVKILDGISGLLGIDESQYRWSYDVLSSIGNMSSATVQFVLADFLKSGVLSSDDCAVMIGIGPGLTIELILFGAERG